MEIETLQCELIKAQEKQNMKEINILLSKIGICYEKNNDIINMKKYYLMAIENNYSFAMCKLGRYYEQQNDFEMFKYYLMAIENNNSDAMNYLGCYCKKINNINNMMKYYLMAIENNNINAMYNLGLYYEEKNEIHNMIKYYLMAIKNGKHYEKIYTIFNKGNTCINFEKMSEIIDIIKQTPIDIDKYKSSMKNIYDKFSREEQYYIRKLLNIKIKEDVIIELKLKNFSKDTDCPICLEELKCIPFNWCNHYICVKCILKLHENKCPYCRLD